MAFGSEYIMQGSQQRAQQSQQIFDRLISNIQHYQQRADQKEYNQQALDMKKAAYENDPERKLMSSIMRVQAGQGTPEDEALINATSAMDGQKISMVSDGMGGFRQVALPTLSDRVYGSKSSNFDNLMSPMSAPVQSARPDPLTDGPGAFSMLNGVQPVDLEGDYSGGGVDTPLNSEQFQQMMLTGQAPQMALPQISDPELASSPDGRKMVGQAEIDLQKQTEGANISAAQKGAETYAGEQAKEAAAREARIKGLTELQASLMQMVDLANAAPSGGLENLGASITNWAGYPSKGAIAQGEFASGKAITGLQSRIEFLKGQGTITDTEAAQALAFIPDANDAREVKVAKLQAAQNFIGGLIGNRPSFTDQNKGRPGFKYIRKVE